MRYQYKKQDGTVETFEGQFMHQESRITRIIDQSGRLVAALRLKTGETVIECPNRCPAWPAKAIYLDNLHELRFCAANGPYWPLSFADDEDGKRAAIFINEILDAVQGKSK